MAKTYIHVMQMMLYSENLNHAEVARWRKPMSISIQMTLYSESLNKCRDCPMAKTYIHVM